MKLRTSKKFFPIAILSLLLALTPLVHAQPTLSFFWTGTTFAGTDPYYSTSVHAYKTGDTATLIVAVSNPFGEYINVTGARVAMDWNGNYTTGAVLVHINSGQQGTVTLTFTVPSPTIASNLVTHDYTITVNYTRPGVPTTQFFNTDGTGFAVYSSDMATDISLMQQFGLPGLLTTTSICGSLGSATFKTSEATSLCLQAAQQADLGESLYASGNFTGARTVLQNAVNLWNQALSTENTKGSSLELGATLGGYGGLLLGIGAIIGGLSALIYALRRKGLQNATPSPR